MPNLRVVLDTNVLVSGLAYPRGTPGQIVAAWKQGAITVVLSRYILNETARVLPCLPRVQLSVDEIRDLIDSLIFMAELVEPEIDAGWEIRDRADAPILGTLLAAKADYLVTGDKDLLALENEYPIVTPAAFWMRHGG